MISDLYKSGMTISEISSEYVIAKSTINDQVKSNKEIKVSEDEIITLKEIARIKEENEILQRSKLQLKSYSHIYERRLDKIIQVIEENRETYSIKKMCSVLGIPRSTYYSKINLKKSDREIKNEKLKQLY